MAGMPATRYFSLTDCCRSINAGRLLARDHPCSGTMSLNRERTIPSPQVTAHYYFNLDAPSYSARPRRVPMIAIMWQFDVRHGHESEFEQLYGVEGEWTAMNRLSRSYLGTSFLHDQNRSSRYIIIEYWSEMLVYEQHRTFRSDTVASLEQRSRALVDVVEPMGVFSALDVPDRFGPAWSQRK